MVNAKIDDNWNPTLIGVRVSDGETPVRAEIDHTTGRLRTDATVTGSVAISQPSTPAVTSVGDTTTSTTILAANTSRKEAEFINKSSATLYLLKGTGTASATNHTVALATDDYYASDYTGAFTGVWTSDAGGIVLVTSST